MRRVVLSIFLAFFLVGSVPLVAAARTNSSAVAAKTGKKKPAKKVTKSKKKPAKKVTKSKKKPADDDM